MTTSFADLLAPMDIATFLREWFFAKPYHARGGAERVAAYPKVVDRAPLLERASCVRAVFAGLRQARIDPGDAEDLFLCGATICVTGAHLGSPMLADLARSAKAALRFSGPVSVRAYWSPPGAGFDVHFDRRVVTTIQVEGTKRWWYSSSPAEVLPLENVSSPLTEAQRTLFEGSEMRSVVLEPGDVLCLPPGTWHSARGESACLAYNLAFDYVDGNIADLLTRALRTELLCTPELRSPLYGDRERPDATIARIRNACIAASDALLEASRRPDLMLRLGAERGATMNDAQVSTWSPARQASRIREGGSRDHPRLAAALEELRPLGDVTPAPSRTRWPTRSSTPCNPTFSRPFP